MLLVRFYNILKMIKLKEIFKKFDEGEIDYAVLRNYENVDNSKDIDMIILMKDKNKVKELLKGFGLRKGLEYGYYFSYKREFIFDFKVECLAYDGFCYEKAESLLGRKRKFGDFYVISEKDECIHLILHSIIDKKYFKEEYMKKIDKLFLKYEKELLEEFERKLGNLGKRLFSLIKNGKYTVSLELRRKLIRKMFSLKGLYNYLIRIMIKILKT